jgi:hypothetical protein
MIRSRISVATLVLLGPVTASAQGSEVATARQLAIQGIDAIESGDCKNGQPMLQRAEQLHHASVHLQYLARCHASAGQLVAATEMWRQIVREGAPAGASPGILAALSEATAELERTLPRLAGTAIRTAAEYPGLALQLDGAPLPSEMVGATQVLDPGEHVLVARAPGFSEWSRRWSVAEGGSAELVIELSRSAGGAGAKPGGPSATPADVPHGGSALRPAGWVTASVGTAALIAGTVTLVMAKGRRSELLTNCPNEACYAPDVALPPGVPATVQRYTAASLESEQQSIRSLMTAANVLMVSGGVLLAGGVTMIVLGGRSDRGPRTALLAGAPGAYTGLTLRRIW